MSGKRYTEEFKQVTDRGHPVSEVASRLGVSAWSLGRWHKERQQSLAQRLASQDQSAELPRLRPGLRRVTEARDILKGPPRTLPGSPGEVRVHQGTRAAARGATYVLGRRCPSDRQLRPVQ